MENKDRIRNKSDLFYLQKALELAKIRRGFCAPNPSVGAVITSHGEIISTGYHYVAGYPHAEIEALKKLNDKIKDATIYITLEPCDHFGKTPPCTLALINSGIDRVVYAYKDPNPIVSGKGHATLAQAGIQCDYVPTSEIDLFYESYAYWHRTKKPFITAKIAMSLDGKIAGKNGEPIQITGKELAKRTHHNRKLCDAILTTSKTIIADNPQFSARYENEVILKSLYVLDSQLTIPINAQIFKTTKSITIFHAKNASLERQAALSSLGAKCIAVDENEQGLNLNEVITLIGADQIHDLWIEAGGRCFSAFVQQNLLQQAFIYIAPHTLCRGVSAFSPDLDFHASHVKWEQAGKDVLCQIRW